MKKLVIVIAGLILLLALWVLVSNPDVHAGNATVITIVQTSKTEKEILRSLREINQKLDRLESKMDRAMTGYGSGEIKHYGYAN